MILQSLDAAADRSYSIRKGCANMSEAPNPARLRDFIRALSELLESTPQESAILRDGGLLLGRLVAFDDWLAPAFAEADPARYRQFLLHPDARGRFSVVSFVWGPGQATPIHDHTVWGLIGMLRGAEYSQAYRHAPDGSLAADGAPRRLLPGNVDAVSPTIGDIHQVGNVYADRVSISIHVYGADIGALQRSVYSADGRRTPFVSGYSNPKPPNNNRKTSP
jgi:predicted metal-dependent enzyme (double-stranded beta helix superfamily)